MSGLGEPAKPLNRQDAELYLGRRRLSCVACGATRFDYREVLMNTSVLTFLELDWANKSALGAVCRDCGAVPRFAVRPSGSMEFLLCCAGCLSHYRYGSVQILPLVRS